MDITELAHPSVSKRELPAEDMSPCDLHIDNTSGGVMPNVIAPTIASTANGLRLWEYW